MNIIKETNQFILRPTWKHQNIMRIKIIADMIIINKKIINKLLLFLIKLLIKKSQTKFPKGQDCLA